MKKLALIILMLGTYSQLHALAVGNPVEASLFRKGLFLPYSNCCDPCDPNFSWCRAWTFRLGYDGDFVFNRYLEVGNDNVDRDSKGDFENVSRHTNAAKLVLNVCNRVDVFARLGQSSFHTRQNGKVFASSLSGIETASWYSKAFSWSIGLKTTLWEYRCCGIGVEGEYFSAKPELDHIVDYSNGEKFYITRLRSRYKEWQVALGLSYRIATSCPTLAFVPYMAIKYAHVDWDHNDASLPIGVDATFFDLHSKKRLGWVLGASFTMCDCVGITVEGRFADEKAFHINGQIRF